MNTFLVFNEVLPFILAVLTSHSWEYYSAEATSNTENKLIDAFTNYFGHMYAVFGTPLMQVAVSNYSLIMLSTVSYSNWFSFFFLVFHSIFTINASVVLMNKDYTKLNASSNDHIN